MSQGTKPNPRPQLTIKGRWLDQIGFYVGCPVIIKIEQGKLEVAAKLGLQLSQYNKYESGMHIPPADKLILLAELFTASIDYLLIGTYDEHSTMSNTRLFERFKALINCLQEEQETVIKLIDEVIVKNRVESALLPVDK